MIRMGRNEGMDDEIHDPSTIEEKIKEIDTDLGLLGSFGAEDKYRELIEPANFPSGGETMETGVSAKEKLQKEIQKLEAELRQTNLSENLIKRLIDNNDIGPRMTAEEMIPFFNDRKQRLQDQIEYKKRELELEE